MKVTCFKAADGTLFENRAKFEAYETDLKLNKALEGVKFNNSATKTDDRGNIVLFEDDIKQFIIDNATTLRTVLCKAAPSRKGRPVGSKNKPKKAAVPTTGQPATVSA